MISMITDTSSYADDFLCHCFSGTVHSVYNKTINIQASGQLLALQSASSPLSPVSLITDLTAGMLKSLHIEPGQAVRFSRESIEILSSGKSVLFRYIPGHIYPSGLSALSAGSSPDVLKSRVQMALGKSAADGFCLLFSSRPGMAGGESLVLSAAREHMSRCRLLLWKQGYMEAARTLSQLIGLGIGLTPSGDDFLCGVLASITLCRLSDHPFARCLIAELESHLSDTNDISATFLRCALQNQFSLAICRLPDLPPADEILQSFEAVGHSSGTDTLCGILYALDLAGFLK
ncbi:DUF2877 domain-containing protein [Extibacter sp. GGCC_0201]|uniref:DUF2877 domain-containing protein n=1 Tax=Extibacter sp. GGCC_0201 TaxID=2731209 RepID=UPI001AA12BDF|nr:DUF2877 domain-containing protein [Extibacter sp. GGCC_0201]MBO1719169.1 DUF2877 domain-containing protein [Extibacter sp. GGCC_0201]BDF34173.1 hypothetical protein CE91St61_22480 [Lachnospiraceae bacterium]